MEKNILIMYDFYNTFPCLLKIGISIFLLIAQVLEIF